MRKTSYYILITFLFFCLKISLFAQNKYVLMSNVNVVENGNILQFPFAGGLEQAQFLAADLNNDGTDDLIVFDRIDDRILTFLNDGIPNVMSYAYHPEYEENFPDISLWINVVDYNCDGIADMFSGLESGVQAYKGSYDANNQLIFELEKSALTYSDSNTPIDVIFEDIPDLIDVNEDGDLDILTNDIGGGNWIYYFENQSVELGYNCDSLLYELVTDCWGSFHANLSFMYDFDTCYSTTSLAANHFPKNKNTSNQKKTNKHFQKNITALDIDGDSDKDLIIGPNNLAGIHLLINNGTTNSADMNTSDLSYLNNTAEAPTLLYQTKAFYVDLNNDGKRDLALGRSETGSSFVGEENVAWMYENANTDAVPNFNFVQKNLLVDQMIDLGRDAIPVFFDVDQDGLTDLILSNYGYYDNSTSNHHSELTLYKNTGTSSNPAFELTQSNFGNLRYFQLQNLHPAFGDLDGDGDADIIMGEKDGNLYYFVNNNGVYNLNILAFTYDVGQFSAPLLVDFDQDGDLDLLCGNSAARMYYFENVGTTTDFDFQFQTNDLGGATQSSPYGYSVPFWDDFGSGQTPELFVSYDNNKVLIFNNIDGSDPTAIFQQSDASFLSNILIGQRLAITGADIDNDGSLEFAIGNRRGGVGIYKDPCAISGTCSSTTVLLKAYLEGTFDGNGNMSNDLTSNGLLPLQQPYNRSPWNYAGTEMVNTMPNNAVDWVLVGLYDGNDSYTLIEQKAVLLLTDGSVQDVNGNAGVTFNHIINGKEYFISLQHRNHLGVMSAVAVNLSNTFSYDFTSATTQAMGNNQQKSIGGFAVLHAGDLNGDGIISVVDYNQYQDNTANVGVYSTEDINLDGNTTTTDFNLYQPNRSVIGIRALRY